MPILGLESPSTPTGTHQHSMVLGKGHPWGAGLRAKQNKKGGAGAEAASVFTEEDKL